MPVDQDDERTVIMSSGWTELRPGQKLHEFEVQEKMGQGGLGIVYRAWDHNLQREVALKEYMPSGMALRTGDGQVVPQSDRYRETFDIGLRSFVAEAVTLAKFEHPALVRVHRNFTANGTAYMVMQLVRGTTLEDVVKAMPEPPGESWLLDLLDPLTTALERVHAERIVHRDIAPDNVMILDGSKRPVLLDFGAARQVIGANSDAATVMFKPSYAAIEQYPDSGIQQGAWTDVYALAAVVHRMVTGKAPPNSQIRQARDGYVPLATRLAGKYSPRFLQAIDHALALMPDQRTSSMGVFRQELGLDESAAEPVGRSRAAASAPAAPKVSPVVWMAAGGLALVLMGGGFWWFASAPAGSEPPVGQAAAPAVTAPPVAATAPAPAPAVVAEPQPQPAAPQPAAAVADAAGPVDPVQAFERILRQQSPEYRVSLSVEAPQLKVNVTSLRLSLESAKDGYYYVLIHDTDREVRLLFPNKRQEQNRIQAGKAVALPPKTVDRANGLERIENMPFGEPLGPARLLAVVSATPLDLNAITKEMNDGFRLLKKGQDAAALQQQSPGRVVYLGRPVCASGAPCPETYGAATASINVVP